MDFAPLYTQIVGCADLGCKIDGFVVARNAYDCEYRSKVLAIRLRNPKAYIRVWNTGKMLVLGAKGLGECRSAARRVARIIQKCDFPVKFLNYRVVNVMTIHDVGPIKIVDLARQYPTQASYEPELLPSAVIIAIHEPKATATVHHTGKIILNGSKSLEFAKKAFEKLFFIVKNFKRSHPPLPPPNTWKKIDYNISNSLAKPVSLHRSIRSSYFLRDQPVIDYFPSDEYYLSISNPWIVLPANCCEKENCNFEIALKRRNV